tara:strand:- start:50 stop:874 length:825 start_codon:yes stop_codon:yes gene_type:complete
MTDLRQAAMQALEALIYCEALNRDVEQQKTQAITALRTALEQQVSEFAHAQEQQAEPVAWMYQERGDEWITTSYSEVENENDGVITPLYTTPPQQQAKMRMPKVGDKVICLEDESLGEVVSLTAGGSPDITFDDGTRGTYLLREFAELFGYAEQRQQQAEPPPEWLLIKNILDEYGLDAIAFVAEWRAAQQQAEPIAYFDFQELKFSWAKHMKISPVPVSIKVDPMKLYSEAAQRPWVGLTDDEITELDMEISGRTMDECVRAIEDKLKAKNDH